MKYTMKITILTVCSTISSAYAADGACEFKTYPECMTRVMSLAKSVDQRGYRCKSQAKAALDGIANRSSDYKTTAEALNLCVKAEKKLKKLNSLRGKFK